jgi:hypothetical protein
MSSSCSPTRLTLDRVLQHALFRVDIVRAGAMVTLPDFGDPAAVTEIALG